MVAGSRRADVEILLRVSRMYYEQGLMQSEIADGGTGIRAFH